MVAVLEYPICHQYYHTDWRLANVSAVIPLVFSTNRLNSAANKLNVPQPVSSQPIPFTDSGFFTVQTSRPQDYLPDLSNYIEDCWYTAALPYLNVHEPLPPITPNTRIHFASFHADSEGKKIYQQPVNGQKVKGSVLWLILTTTVWLKSTASRDYTGMPV